MYLFKTTHVGLCACVLTLSIASTSALASVGSIPVDPPITQTIRGYLDTNPAIAAAESSVVAARARLSGAALPINNPELSIDGERTDIDTYSIGISQTLDWHDKRGVTEEGARLTLRAAEAELELLRLNKSRDLLQAIGRIVTRQQVTLLAKRRSELLQRFRELAEQRFRAGDISRAELDLAHLSYSEAVMSHATNGSDLIEARSDYLTLSGEALNGTVRFPRNLPLKLSPVDGEQQLVNRHPEMEAAHLRARVARQQVAVADQGRKADPTIGIAAGREDSESLVALSLSIPLQIRNSFREEVSAAEAEALREELLAQQSYRQVLARLRGAGQRYQLVANAWSVWIGQGAKSLQQRFQLLESQWQAGEMGTTDYLLQIQQTLDTQISGAQLHGDLWSAWIDWLMASGELLVWLGIDNREQ